MTPDAATDDSGAVLINRHVEVFPDDPLPDLDSPNARAFGARDRRSPDRPMFALLCQRDVQPRFDVARPLSRMETAAMLRPQAWGVTEWPLDGREHRLVAFDRPGGPRVVLADDEGRPSIREDDLARDVIPAMAALLGELRGRMIGHRAIRAGNLFYSSEARSGIVLGECVSEPPAFSQPVVYESVANGMASSSGRGAGYPSDDVYAMGVLLIALLSGHEPCAGMSAEEIIDCKIRLGSFATLVREVRVSLSLMEPLRGMLCDSPAHRWSAEDLLMWAGGKHQTTKPHSAPRKMGRPFSFNGADYWHASTLAHAMASNWEAAVESHPATPLITWLRKAYGDSSVRNAFADKAQFLVATANKGADAGDRVLASLLAMLDPEAPIRFRSLSVQPEALGQVLALEYGNKALVEDFKAAFEARLPNTWLELQPVSRPEFVPLKKALELTQFFLSKEGWGFGIERCLYELNGAWPCQSPLLDRFLVTKVEHLLPALERLAAEGLTEGLPVDSHIAAFCAAHIKDLPKQVLIDLTEPAESSRHHLAALALLAKAQAAGRDDPAPGVCRWLFRYVSPVIAELHNRPYRQKLAERLQSLAEQGDLGAMLDAADNSKVRDRDDKGFERARHLYERADREIAWLRDGGLTRPEQLRRGSEQASLMLSSMLSGLALLALTMMMVL